MLAPHQTHWKWHTSINYLMLIISTIVLYKILHACNIKNYFWCKNPTSNLKSKFDITFEIAWPYYIIITAKLVGHHKPHYWQWRILLKTWYYPTSNSTNLPLITPKPNSFSLKANTTETVCCSLTSISTIKL